MRNITRKAGAFFVAGMLAVSLLALGACAQPQSAASSASESASAVPALRTFGEKTDTAVALEITNASKKDIIALSVKSSQSEAFGASFVTEATKIAADETIILYVEPVPAPQPTGDAGASGNTDRANDVVLRTLYNVSLTFGDNTTAELHDLNLEGLAKLSLCLSDDGIAYVEFTDANNTVVSTLETERALKAAAEEAARAEAEAAAAQQYQGATGGYGYDTGASSNTGSQSADACVPEGDLIMN